MRPPQQEGERPPPSGQGNRGVGQANSGQVGGSSGRSIRPFDPWNSSSTGHQRAETRGPQGWRESRVAKLHSQFRAGHSGGERISDRVGAGSEDFNERLGMLVSKELRARAMNSVANMLRNPEIMRQRHSSTSTPQRSCSPEKSEARSRPGPSLGPGLGATGSKVDANTQNLGERGSMTSMPKQEPPPLFMEIVEGVNLDEGDEGLAADEPTKQEEPQQQRKIFDGLVIYINGSTHPVISDHKLKRVLAENGACISIHLGRRQVTHVILGKPSGPTGGAGGGLAGGKLEKEIQRISGCGIKYVSVEW